MMWRRLWVQIKLNRSDMRKHKIGEEDEEVQWRGTVHVQV
jgi:hypothetical protein